jgi:PAS domain
MGLGRYQMTEELLTANRITALRSGDWPGVDIRTLVEHETTLAIYDYWLNLCGDRSLPNRAAIKPAQIASHLPHILLLDIEDQPLRFRYRLAGTAIREARKGLDILDQTGRYADEIDHNYSDNDPIMEFKDCYTQRQPILIRGTFDDSMLVFGYYERLTLPLSVDQDRPQMLLVSFVQTRMSRKPAVD